MKRITIVLIAILLMVSALIAFPPPADGMRMKDAPYYGPNHHFGMERGGRARWHRYGMLRKKHGEQIGFILSELELTDKQWKQVDKIKTSYQSERIEKLGKIRKLQFDKRTALRHNNFKKAKELNNKIFELKKEMSNITINMKKDIRNILTDKQKEKLDNLKIQGRFHRFSEFEEEDEK